MDEEVDDERLQELRERQATLEEAIAELEEEKANLPGKKNKPARQKVTKKIKKLQDELEVRWLIYDRLGSASSNCPFFTN